MYEGKFLMLTPSVGVEQFWDVSKMESMWMRTSRVEAAYMGGVCMILILTAWPIPKGWHNLTTLNAYKQ
jgi:hypothetical protein